MGAVTSCLPAASFHVVPSNRAHAPLTNSWLRSRPYPTLGRLAQIPPLSPGNRGGGGRDGFLSNSVKYLTCFRLLFDDYQYFGEPATKYNATCKALDVPRIKSFDGGVRIAYCIPIANSKHMPEKRAQPGAQCTQYNDDN